MAGHLQHLNLWNGRFPARIVVPRAPRTDPDATAELDIHLADDRREALPTRAAPEAIAETSIAKVTSVQRDGVALHRLLLKA
ncbi:MAG: hypothetical protein U1A06_13135 [Hoeflea sp.]|nr:hypothetical protein [Hoeflea sp.]